jgi:hypothetical protein
MGWPLWALADDWSVRGALVSLVAVPLCSSIA